MNNEKIREEWNSFNNDGLFTTADEADIVADFWLSKLDQAREEERRRVGEEVLEKIKEERWLSHSFVFKGTISEDEVNEMCLKSNHAGLDALDTIVRDISGKEKA